MQYCRALKVLSVAHFVPAWNWPRVKKSPGGTALLYGYCKIEWYFVAVHGRLSAVKLGRSGLECPYIDTSHIPIGDRVHRDKQVFCFNPNNLPFHGTRRYFNINIIILILII